MLILGASFAFAQEGFAKEFQLNNVSLKEFFQVVEKDYGYSFMYNNKDIDDSRVVTIKSSKDDINSILTQAFSGLNVNYEINAKQIVLTSTAKAAQEERTISGVVVGPDGESLLGAAVRVDGTTVGTSTNVNGEFTLTLPAGATHLLVNYLGYEDQQVVIGRQSRLRIEMSESASLLDEVIVIGYGSIKKSDLTAAISTVDSDQMTKVATSNPAEALQGLVSGVNVQRTDGLAGSGVSIKIRGVNTFGGNEPLYIIDGFYGDINDINQNDIEDIQILKDGAASAIYGSIAANGVVLITTKSGKAGEIKVDLNSYASVRKVHKKPSMLNAGEYVEMHRRMYDEANKYRPSNDQLIMPGYITNPSGYDTNWQDEVYRTGVSLNQSVMVRGGFKETTFTLSGNISDDKGILINNNFTKQNVRARIGTKKGIFSIDGSLAYRASKYKSHNVRLKEVLMISPLVPVRYTDDEGVEQYGLTNSFGMDLPGNANPVAESEQETAWNKRQHFDGNFSVGVDIYKGLTFKTSYGYRGNHYQYYYHRPAYVADPKSPSKYPYYSESRTFWEEQVFDNLLNYDQQFGRHSINAMLGTSMKLEKSNWNSAGVEGKTVVYRLENGAIQTGEEPVGFSDPNFMTLNAGRGGTYSGEGSNYKYNRMSYFGRVNYSYDSRYLFQFTLRRDGSSKFGRDKRWGTFPSVAVGWNISEEAFIPETSKLSTLKLRLSWGRLGNEVALGYYDSHALIETGNTNWMGSVQGMGSTPWPGGIARDLENRDLRWEVTESINMGVDYGFFNNKLSGSVNYYQHKTKDLLITKTLPPSSGMKNPVLNVGEMKNQGFEFEINWQDNVSDFYYNVGMNMSYLKNEMSRLADADQEMFGTGVHMNQAHFVNKTVQGRPIGAFFLYTADGIFQSMDEVNAHVNSEGDLLQPHAKPGDVRFRDVNNDGAINASDMTYKGTGMPKWEINLNLAMEYKGFDFSAQIGSGWGHKLYNGNRFLYEGMNSGSNFFKSTLNAWTPENPNTSMPRAVIGDPNQNARESTRFLEDGDFIRLRNIQIGYTLPKSVSKKIRIDKLRFYVSAHNLATWTKYSGIDPEFSRAPINTGTDAHVFPFTRSWTFGMQLTF